MFLYDKAGNVVGHCTPRHPSAEERRLSHERACDFARRLGLPEPPNDNPPEPLEIRYGRVKRPGSQGRLEWLTEDVRRSKGQEAAEAFYQLALAAEQGPAELQERFDDLFPPENSER